MIGKPGPVFREDLGKSAQGGGDGPQGHTREFGLYSEGSGFKKSSHVIRFSFCEEC